MSRVAYVCNVVLQGAEDENGMSQRVAVLEAAGVEMRENLMNEIVTVSGGTGWRAHSTILVHLCTQYTACPGTRLMSS